ncbi:MAG: DNA polymerase III subunit gamma/tau [Desulfovibrio sp.]|nr:DNA polymerase III subunit gamma/tau [Desulfovibrio sp.]
MKHLSLAARYRPQTFSQVAGQDMVKAVLSRAAAESRPAAAYLLSGTRGVGKTTIARIFAKALNCERGPATEPCNQCAQCRKITQGSHVDVAEIDGASNNGVEDARALRETIGYAPMEGRYKVFIIDEAHMLSRSAFNALLKTLEEPPERVVFIFATTEAHKFLPTIVSRCQHFVFRHLSEDTLTAHLSQVLQREEKPFEEGAVRLLARRAAGSVRDGMSLLDQVLALGGDVLTAEATRQVLGLAGQEVYAALFDALQGRDCAAVAALTGKILQQGVDIGFFVRELAGCWRDLFLLRQGGAALLPSLHLPADEGAFLQNAAARFSPGHLHAAWQMTLDAQRGIVQSPEPAAALELLLLNLALLPQLLPLEHLPVQNTAGPMPARAAHDESPSGPPGEKPPPAMPARRAAAVAARRDWKAFQEFCAGELAAGRPAPQAHVLRGLEVSWQEGSLRLVPAAQAQFTLLEAQRPALEAALAAYGAGGTRLELVCPKPPRTHKELVEEFSRNPKLQDCLDILKATVTDCGPVNRTSTSQGEKHA